jgi:hypothetical protein
MARVVTVANQPDLKEIEKRAYTSYHQDGLLDIFAGAYILAFSLGMLTEVFWGLGMGSIMPAISVAVMLPIWIAAKKRITMPRIGFVKFGVQSGVKFMAVLSGVMLVGLFFALTLFQGGRPLWLDVIRQYGLIAVGVGALVICSLFGYIAGLSRLYAYGLLALLVLGVGHFMGIFFAYLLLPLGIAVMVTGLYLLTAFVRKYPLRSGKVVASQ